MLIYNNKECMLEQLKVNESEYAVKYCIAIEQQDGYEEMFLLGMLVSIRKSIEDLKYGKAHRTFIID